MKTPILALAVALITTACGDNKPTPAPGPRAVAPPVTTAAAVTASADAGVTEAAAPYVYTYVPLGKRDPFRSPVEDMRQTAGGNTFCNEPLCQWDLDQLSLVAVVTGDANPLAMVQDPQTRGYLIHRGTKMGKQGGQVTQILRDSVTVTEYFQTPDGKRNPNAVTLHLKTDAMSVPSMDFFTGKNVE